MTPINASNQVGYISKLIDPANYSQPVDLEFNRVRQLNQQQLTEQEQKFYKNISSLLVKQVHLNEGILTPEKLDEVIQIPSSQTLDERNTFPYSPPESVPAVGKIRTGNPLGNHSHLENTIRDKFLQQRKDNTLRGQIESEEQKVIDYLKSKDISYEPTLNIHSDKPSFLSKYMLIIDISFLLSQSTGDKKNLCRNIAQFFINNGSFKSHPDEEKQALTKLSTYINNIITLESLSIKLEDDELTQNEKQLIEEQLSTCKHTLSACRNTKDPFEGLIEQHNSNQQPLHLPANEETLPTSAPLERGLNRASSCSATTKAVAVVALAVFLGTLSVLRQ